MSLQKYINERLKITSKSKPLTLKPKTKDELKAIIEQELEAQGPDADLNHIDVSEITDMSGLFINFDIINIKIDRWRTSNVTSMKQMFLHCSEFVGTSLDTWDTSNVKDMSYMFNGCKNLNADLPGWDTSNVKDMSYMFNGCKNFNSDLSQWNVSNVVWMPQMFYKCEKLNSDISRWDVSNVRNMDSMFYGCTSLEQDLSGWDIQKATKYRRHMFMDCPKMKMKMKPTVKK